jgi:hypothetical protein
MSLIGTPRKGFNVMAYNKQKRDRTTRLERAAVRRLATAVRETERDHPLPRCEHGKPLRDGGGEALEPSCGCRLIGMDNIYRPGKG